MENKILELFTKSHSLKFNEIEKSLSQRSNKLAYHLNNLVKKQVLKKENQTYSLTESSEYLIPYLSNKNAVIPVILIHIGTNKSAFLYQRKKRPHINKLSLPGGRLIQRESILQAAKRIALEKCNIDIVPESISSLTLEHVKRNKQIIHSFLLILVKAKTKYSLTLTNLKANKRKIISSDYKLISSSSKYLPLNIETVFTKS